MCETSDSKSVLTGLLKGISPADCCSYKNDYCICGVNSVDKTTSVHLLTYFYTKPCSFKKTLLNKNRIKYNIIGSLFIINIRNKSFKIFVIVSITVRLIT